MGQKLNETTKINMKQEQIQRKNVNEFYKPSPMRRLIFFKTFILLFMGENELSSLQ